MGDRRTCPECGSGELLTITMMVEEHPLAFTACHECEAKWWSRDGEPTTLPSVIEVVTVR